MPLILPGNVGSATAATGFNVANSARLDGASSFMRRTNNSSASSSRIMTISWWMKKCKNGSEQKMYTAQASMETAITNASDTPALETLYTYTTTDGVQSRPLGELPILES